MKKRRLYIPHPVVILFSMLVLAGILIHMLPAGKFERELEDGREKVVPGSYQVLEKDRAVKHLWSTGHDTTDATAQPVSLVTTLTAIPAGLDRMSGLIFMVLIIGGMFGILTRSDDHTMDLLPDTEVMKRWWKHMADIMQTHPDNVPVQVPLKRVFHLP